MHERFTDRARKVMQLANQEAQRFHHEYIGTEHILLGLVKEGSGVAANVLKNLDINLQMVRLEVEKIVQAGPDVVTAGKLPHTPRAKKVIEYAIEEARKLDHNYVGTEHLLLGLIREGEGVAALVLINLGLRLEEVREEVHNLLGRVPQPEAERPACKSGPIVHARPVLYEESPKTPELERISRDLTARARRGELDPVVGRERDIERILLVLGCRTQNVPLLVGPAGVGKSALVRGLARAAVADDAPQCLAGRRLVALNLARLILLTKDRGDLFTDAIGKVTDECRQAKNVLLYLEDLFTFGSSGRLLLSALLSEKIPCLLAATTEMDDPLIERHCQKIVLEPPTAEEAVEILRAHRPALEDHHRVRIGDDALPAAVHAAGKYLTDGVLPGTALQLLSQACSLVRLANEPGRPDLKDLERQLELLTFEKEAAVARQDFDKAAQLRDEADKLKQRRLRLFREWHEKTPDVFGAVDAGTVNQVVSKLTGIVFRGPQP
jgi:ATP-dependent Clp protease ATP-binding subunit ClpC